jgi:phenylpropionate dioxygenase-like ring-hydroxylating dioxygenase large terminal subunit
MEQSIQEELLSELLALHGDRKPYLDEHWEKPDLERYYSAQFFRKEREHISLALPQIAAHSSELPEPGAFLTMELGGRPLLLVRDKEGATRAFYNVCRHRGAQLVGEKSGCRHRFSCPYHAWTWNNTGQLIGVPHEKSGFPGLDRGDHGLKTLACEEFGGWIWVSMAGDGEIDVQSHLGDLARDILGMEAGSHVIFDSTVRDVEANWKLLVEGGMESYHFRVAHKDTIAPLFLDNLSSYRCFGPHIRSILPRSTLPELREQPREAWELGKHANVLYSLFPGSQFLVQEDHFVWIHGVPLAPNRTRLRLSTLIPQEENTFEKQKYWQRNHLLTTTTLDEDFDLGEGIQQGLESGANEHLNFGRFEGALTKFNDFVDAAIS